MARTRIPDAIQRRDLIEQKLDPARARKVADAYLEQDRVLEALPFLERAEARDELAAIRDAAVSSGDVFLLRETALRLGEEPDADTWRRLAEVAAAAGKASYAAEAQRQLAAREAS